jgi:hypothetical protein
MCDYLSFQYDGQASIHNAIKNWNDILWLLFIITERQLKYEIDQKWSGRTIKPIKNF